jgi:transcriptional regulator with AAA-type ATPase domain
MIINDYTTGKMDIWTARKLLKKELNRYRSNLEIPEFRCIREKLERRYSGNIKQLEKYLEEIETILIQEVTPGSKIVTDPAAGAKRGTSTAQEEFNELMDDLCHRNEESKRIYDAINRGIAGEKITKRPKEKLLNFFFSVASVARLFSSYSNNKRIYRCILINGEKVNINSFRVAKKNYQTRKPEDWDDVNKILRLKN